MRNSAAPHIRLRHARIILGFLTLFLPGAVSCQSLGYADADSEGEAIGMLRVAMRSAEVMRDECVSRFPDSQAAIDANWLKWKTVEAGNLKKAEVRWAEMSGKNPQLGETLSYVDVVVKRTLQMVLEMPGQTGAKAGASVISQYCKEYFAGLASGVWRVRTPRAYGYMDQLP